MRSGCSEEGFRNEVFFKRDGAHGGLDDASALGVSSMWKDHSPYTKGNFEFERVVRGWRTSYSVLDLRLKR
jgi:hypothetical protein